VFLHCRLRGTGIIPEVRRGGVSFEFSDRLSLVGQVKAAPVFV